MRKEIFYLVDSKNFNKYNYFGYGTGFNAYRSFSLSDGSGFGRNIIISDADTSSYAHIDNRKKEILIIGKDPTQGLDDTALAAEKEYTIEFTEHQKKFCFSLHCNGVNSYLFVNDVEIYKFKTKDSEINAGSLCLGNISKEFLADYMKKNGLYG